MAKGQCTALAAWAGSVAAMLSIDDPRLRFPTFLAFGAIAIGAWLIVGRSALRGELDDFTVRVATFLALAARVLCLFAAPAFSEDAFRAVYEGRVVWQFGPGFPFAHPPADAPILGVAPELMDAAWRRINHPEIPTLYPPISQAVFVAAGGLGDLVHGHHLLLLKLLLVFADLVTIAAVRALLRVTGRPVQGHILLSLCPVLIFEIAREGHADALCMLGLTLGALGFARRRPAAGYLGFAIAALAKLSGLLGLVVAARYERRWLWVGALTASALALPWLFAGSLASDGITQYTTRWRSGDGVFGLLLALAEAMLGGDHALLLGSVVTRHTLARALSALLFATYGAAVLLRKTPTPLRKNNGNEISERTGALLVGLLLLSPTLHPWYTLWALPFALFTERNRPTILYLVSTAWLLHHPGWLELSHGSWTEIPWVRALVHIPVWVLLLRSLVSRSALGYLPRTVPVDGARG